MALVKHFCWEWLNFCCVCVRERAMSRYIFNTQTETQRPLVPYINNVWYQKCFRLGNLGDLGITANSWQLNITNQKAPKFGTS